MLVLYKHHQVKIKIKDQKQHNVNKTSKVWILIKDLCKLLTWA